MFTEADNLAITRTELDSVFFQQFEIGSGSAWGVATAENGKLFRVVNTTHSAYIHMVNMGTGKWSAIGETEIVPSDTPKVSNKNTVLVSDFGQKILISKNLFDDNMHDVWAEDVRQFALTLGPRICEGALKLVTSVKFLIGRITPSQALAF